VAVVDHDQRESLVLLPVGRDDPRRDLDQSGRADQAATADSAKSVSVVTIPDADHGYGFYSDQPAVDAMLHDALVSFFRKALH
jgi:hypothetical protein